MTEYVTTGSEGTLDTSIKGYPVGEVSVITGDAQLNLESFINIQARNNDILVITQVQTKELLERKLPDGTDIHIGSIDKLDEGVESYDTVIVEAIGEVDTNQLVSIASNNVAVLVINPDLRDRLAMTASVILEVNSKYNERSMVKTIIVKKHSHKDNNIQPISVTFDPLPRPSDKFEA